MDAVPTAQTSNSARLGVYTKALFFPLFPISDSPGWDGGRNGFVNGYHDGRDSRMNGDRSGFGGRGPSRPDRGGRGGYRGNRGSGSFNQSQPTQNAGGKSNIVVSL